MTSAELSERKRERPFIPFRVQLRDGRSYPVYHPRLILVGGTSAIIGIPPQGSQGPFYEGTVTVNLADIVRLEPLEQGQFPTKNPA